MSACVDSPTTGRIGCGATYSGEMQHCVARADWSQHPDGRAHITASLSVLDKLWAKGASNQPANPVDHGMEQDDRGRWRVPLSDEAKATLAAKWMSFT